MSSRSPQESSGRDDPRGDAEFQRILVGYLDELNLNGFVDPDQIHKDHPVLAPAILEDLETYAQLHREENATTPLGVLGDYTLRRQIGRGGMGVVYEAWQSSLDRQVALKVLPAGVAADNRAFLRFMQEAKTAAKLSHPNVVGVFGMGVEQKTPYFAMEFVKGETIAQILEKLMAAEPEAETPFGKKDHAGYFEKIADAFADVAEGLQHAHSQRVIHRDIKPSNLILDREGRLRILDFGLARLEGQESLTLSGDFLGTPQYMSPEQAGRRKIPVDHRTDIYSLGATMYESLTLRPPFKGKDHSDTLSQIIERDPIEPRKLNPRIPKDLETIVLKCLRKYPADRYGTAEALAQDLRRFTRGEMIEARAQSRWERLLGRTWRNRAKASVALVMALLILAVGWLAWQRQEAERVRRGSEYESKVLSAVLKIELASVIHYGLLGGRPTKDLSAIGGAASLDRALLELDEAQALVPTRPDSAYHRTRALLCLDQEEKALREVGKLIERHPRFTPAILLECSILERRGELSSAKSLKEGAETSTRGGWAEAWLQSDRSRREGRFSEVINASSRLIEADESKEPFIGSALAARLARGAAYLEIKEPIQALLDFRLAAYLAPGSPEPVLLEGKAWHLLGKREEATRLFEKVFGETSLKTEIALAIADIYQSLGENQIALEWVLRMTPGRAQVDRWMWALWDLGRFDDAIEVGRQAIAKDPDDSRVHANLGWILGIDLSRMEEALPHAMKATQLDPKNAEWRFWLGALFKAQGKFEEAVEAHQASLDLDPRNAMVRSFLARCYVLQGKFEEARRAFAQSNEIDPRNVYVLDQEAMALIDMGKPDDALEVVERAIPCDPFCSEPRYIRGIALEQKGRFGEAAEEYLKGGRYRRRTPISYLWRERVLERLGRSQEALPGYLELLEFDAKNAPAHWRIAHLLSVPDMEGHPEAANRLLEVLEKAAPEAQQDPWLLNSRALALSLASPGKRDLEQAIECALRGLERGEAHPAVFEELTATLAATLGCAKAEGAMNSLPRLPPYRAIEELVENETIVARYPGVEDPRALFLQGKLLERSRSWGDAIDLFSNLAQVDPAHPEPVLALARCLRAAGEPARAEKELRFFIEMGKPVPREVWDQWALVSLLDLKRTPAKVLAELPRQTDAVSDGAEADLRWLLERLVENEPIRINCGGDEYQSADGAVFGRDRFSLGGKPGRWSAGAIAGTRDAPLYQSGRWFPAWEASLASYRIPLPPGRYRISLHFAEGFMLVSFFPGAGAFDVLIEGEPVLTNFQPASAGVCTAHVRAFEVEIQDGLIEIQFVPRVDHPKVSAIEIERVE